MVPFRYETKERGVLLKVMRSVQPKGGGKGRGVGRVDYTQAYTHCPLSLRIMEQAERYRAVTLSSIRRWKDPLTPATFPVFSLPSLVGAGDRMLDVQITSTYHALKE